MIVRWNKRDKLISGKIAAKNVKIKNIKGLCEPIITYITNKSNKNNKD